MNKNIKNKSLFVFFPILIFIGLLFSYIFIDGFLNAVIGKIYYVIVIFFAITSGYNGYVLTRLNILDNLDSLKDIDADKIRKTTISIRKLLDKVIPFSIYCAGILLISSFVVEIIPNTHIFIGIFSSFTIAIGIFLLNIITHSNHKIADLIYEVNNLSRIEKKRQALLAEMRKDVEEEPFSHMDLHLRKYKKVINS
jgi:hypothetical protein